MGYYTLVPEFFNEYSDTFIGEYVDKLGGYYEYFGVEEGRKIIEINDGSFIKKVIYKEFREELTFEEES